MKYYEAIVGSRCFGLELPDSDTDIAVVGDTWETKHTRDGLHVMQCPKEYFWGIVTYEPAFIHAHQWLYPAHFLSTGEVTSFLVEYRDQIIAADLPQVWQMNWDTAVSLRNNAQHYFGPFPKRLVYSTLRFETLARYAAGVPFAEAFKPSKELHPVLIAMRRGELSLQEAIAVNTAVMKCAKKTFPFYEKPKDYLTLNTVKEELSRLLLLH